MRYKLYTQEVGGALLEEPGTGPEHWYEAKTLAAAETKSRKDVDNFNASLRPREKPREFVRVIGEGTYADEHPEEMAGPQAVMDFWFTHLQSDSEMGPTVLRTITDVMDCFRGETSRSKGSLALGSLVKWLEERDCEVEARMVRGIDLLGYRFQDYRDEFIQALCGRMPKAQLRSMLSGEYRTDKNGSME